MSNSPICTVNGTATTNGVNVSAGINVNVALADTAGVTNWQLTCINTDELNLAATINATLVVNQISKTATFTSPATPGSSLIFRSVINNGRDINNQLNSAYSTTFEVCVPCANLLRVIAFGEKTEGNAQFGWITKLNDLIRNFTATASSAGAGLTGFYAVGQNADGSIIVNADDIQLKPAFTTLLNGATTNATANTLALRNGTGGCSFAGLITTTFTATAAVNMGSNLTVTGNTSLGNLTASTTTLNNLAVTTSATIGTTLNVTGTTTLGVVTTGAATHSSLAVTAGATVGTSLTVGTTLGVTGTTTLGVVNTGAATVGSTLGVTTSVTSPSYLFTTAASGINRTAMIPPQADPANWKSTTNGQWINLSLGTKVVCNLDPPQGATLTGFVVRFAGAAAHAGLPANMPVADLRYYDVASNLDLSIGSATDSSASTGAFQANHSISASGLSHTVNKIAARYHLDLTAESGANALVGGTLVYVQYIFTRPAGSSVGID